MELVEFTSAKMFSSHAKYERMEIKLAIFINRTYIKFFWGACLKVKQIHHFQNDFALAVHYQYLQD